MNYARVRLDGKIIETIEIPDDHVLHQIRIPLTIGNWFPASHEIVVEFDPTVRPTPVDLKLIPGQKIMNGKKP